MDSFMDKIAQKFSSAGDMIRANSEADAKAYSEAKNRIKDLEEAVSEMRRLSLKCAEINEVTTQVARGAIERLDEATESGKGIDPEALKEITQSLEALKTEMNDTVHKENVRVYRNVQAALVDELKQQSEAIAAEHLHMEKKIRGIKPVAIISLVFSGITMAALVAAVYGIFFMDMFR